MSLADDLAGFTSTQAAEWCEANGFHEIGSLCRMFVSDTGFVEFLRSHPEVNAASFAAVQGAVVANKWFFDAVLDGMKTHMPHRFVPPTPGLQTVSRVELTQRTCYQPGGILSRGVILLDDEYQITDSATIRRLLDAYKDPYPYQLVGDECDKKARRIWSFFASIPMPRPLVGFAVIGGQVSGQPFGHALNFVHCTDGDFWIDNDKVMYSLTRSMGWMTEITVTAGMV